MQLQQLLNVLLKQGRIVDEKNIEKKNLLE